MPNFKSHSTWLQLVATVSSWLAKPGHRKPSQATCTPSRIRFLVVENLLFRWIDACWQHRDIDLWRGGNSQKLEPQANSMPWSPRNLSTFVIVTDCKRFLLAPHFLALQLSRLLGGIEFKFR